MATITKRNESYRIKVSLGYDSGGKQIIKSMTWKPEAGMTKRQIEKELNRQATLFEEQCKQINLTIRRMTFRSIAEEWINTVESTHELKIASIERLKSCREFVYSRIGNQYVDRISFRELQQLVIELSQKGTKGKGLSEKSQKHYFNFISDVMNYAIKCEMITENPCKNVKAVKTEKKEKQIYSLEEEIALLERLAEKAPTDYKLFFTLCAYTGMRRGELLGLEWKDIDFESGVLSIVRTSNYRNSNTGTYTSTPKTKASCRFIKLSEEILSLFKSYKSEQDEQCIKCGDQWHESDRIFISWNGEPMHPNTAYTWLQRFCESEDLAFYGIHAFRHSFATAAITSGKIDIKTVSAILGHSQTSTTLNIYAHEIAKTNAAAMNIIADIIHDEQSKKK